MSGIAFGVPSNSSVPEDAFFVLNAAPMPTPAAMNTALTGSTKNQAATAAAEAAADAANAAAIAAASRFEEPSWSKAWVDASPAVTGAGDPFLSFGAAALDAALSGLVVCDPVAGQVTSVDLASGDRSLLSGDEAGFGPRLLGPTGLAARVDGDGLYLVTGEGAALLLEPTTGDRVVLSL